MRTLHKSLGYFKRAFFIAGVLVLVNACSKYYDPPPVFENAVDKPFTKKRKILLIVVDGAAGPEVKKIAPPTLMGLTEHAKYSWGAFGDARSGDGPSWINILTGKSAAASAISDSTLAPVEEEEEGHEHEELPVYSNFFQRLLVSGYLSQTVAITPWNTLAELGLTYAGNTIAAANDQAVKDSAVRALTNEKLGVMLVNFNGVNLAGRAAAFSADEPAYKSAVLQVDAYIKEIMDALAKRPNAAQEDWLTIVTSNHGGDGDSYGGATVPERKIFMIYNNPNFIKRELLTPALMPLTTLSGPIATPVNATLDEADASLYNFGTTGEYTVQLKVKFASRGSTWPAFFGKKGTSYNDANNPGWLFMLYDPAGAPKWRPFVGGSKSGQAPVSQLSDDGLVLNVWNTLTMKIYDEGSKRLVAGYTNGARHKGTFEITGRNLSNNLPLTIGAMPGWISTGPTFNVADIRIYNTALPDNVIADEYCNSGITSNDPYYNNLIGYWPGSEGDGTVLKNKAPGASGKDFVFARTNSWNLIVSNFCGNASAPDEQLLQNTEIAPNLFYWLNLNPLTAWGFESKEWLSTYETEFIK
ncbi:LamG-like jellyroll fold domain-containing protein [Niabella aurantiaca]|uniref:LamG-like jellyroll fold domain-containing protein n=1 Tax=Niabella aurantiaca TaxID=379900 RepID=UPI00037D2CA9|nr:LamG-like jellyroll fold domain-containing protein [Niabella aurantiaca]